MKVHSNHFYMKREVRIFFSIIAFIFVFLFFYVEIGLLKSLETLNFCRNRLTEIPVELAMSTSIRELFFNDNDLSEIPTKVMSLQNLKVFEAESKLLLLLLHH